jgi:hypothetical protein
MSTSTNVRKYKIYRNGKVVGDWMGGPCNDEPSDNPCNSGISVQNGTL